MKLASLVALCLATASVAPAPTRKDAVSRQNKAKASVQTSQAFLALADRFVKDSLALSPVSASYAGYHKHPNAKGEIVELDAVLDDVGPAAFAEQRQFYTAWRQRFAKEAPLASLGLQDAADWQLIDDQIARNLLDLERIESYKHNPTVLVETIGNAIFLPLSQGYAPKETRLAHVL